MGVTIFFGVCTIFPCVHLIYHLFTIINPLTPRYYHVTRILSGVSDGYDNSNYDKDYDHVAPFRVPFAPIIPLLAIFANTFLFSSLGKTFFFIIIYT